MLVVSALLVEERNPSLAGECEMTSRARDPMPSLTDNRACKKLCLVGRVRKMVKPRASRAAGAFR
jgi:hypothetical protein